MHRFVRFAFVGVLAGAVTAGCGTAEQPASNAGNRPAATNTAPAAMNLATVGEPSRIGDLRAKRGEQDAAAPVLRIVAPANGSTVDGSTVQLRVALSGDLKGYRPGKDPATGLGNHVHVILDNQPYEAWYNIDEPFELRNVSPGKHTIRVFPSRPWHESYKNEGAFQMVEFTVAGGATNANAASAANANTANANTANTNAHGGAAHTAPTGPEGKDMQPSTAGAIDLAKPLLTYSRPKGEYKGEEADPIMIDFWLANARLQGDGGEYRVRYSVDGGAPQYIDKWAPIWLGGWTAGKHTVKVELVDKEGNVVDNGGYNSTSRDITVAR